MPRKTHAFTLIELLVVISIIALLIAILMPALNKAREQASGAVCLSNQKTLILAWTMYGDENDGIMAEGHVTSNNGWVQPPQDADGNYNVPPMENKLRGIERGTLFPYIKTVDSYHCPGDKRLGGKLRIMQAFRSYGICGGLNGEEKSSWRWGTWGGKNITLKKMSEIKFPASKSIFVEETDNRGYNMGSWLINPNYTWVDPVPVWHNGNSTIVFGDSHAEMHGWLDQRTMQWSKEFESGAGHFVMSTPDSPDWDFMFRAYATKNNP